MKRLLAAVLFTACAAARAADPLPPVLWVTDTDLGGQIILQPTIHCEAPMQEWSHFIVTRADGLVVASGCWSLSKDNAKIIAREGATLYPIVWPIGIFKRYTRK